MSDGRGAESIAIAVEGPAERAETAALVWPVLAALAGVAAALPLWAGHLLPFQDAPQHLASVRVLADFHTPGFQFARWFEIDLGRSQYLGFYLPAALLSLLVGPDAACRLVLSVVALALPAASWMLLGAFNRDRRLAVFAPAVFHTAPLYLGFFNFVESVPIAIAVVALVERELHGSVRWRGFLLAGCAVALLYVHPSALAFAVCAALFLAATAALPLRRRLRGLLPLAPALALLAVWTTQSLLHQPAGTARAGAYFTPFGVAALDLARFGNVLAAHVDELFVGALWLLWLMAALVPGRPRIDRFWRLPLLAAATLAAYFLCPRDLGIAGSVSLRALPFFALLLLASPVLAPGRITSLVLAAAVALQLAYAGKLMSAYRAFDEEAQVSDLETVLRAADPGKRLIALIWDRQSRVVQGQSYLHFGAYYELERGGRALRNFAEFPWTPIRFRAGSEPVSLPPGWEYRPEQFDARREGADEDYVLVRGPAALEPPPPFVLKARAGVWELYGR
jgi:hypothetical protein